MKLPVVSIITITYNASRWLERTILSILSQSYSNIEYIIIDGGSTDGTVDIIKQYASGISYWVSEPDKGIYDAMNKGLQKATGDYVWFINAGDSLYTSDTVQRVVSLVQKKKVLPDIIYGETSIIDEDGNSQGRRRLKAPDKLSWKSFRMGMLVCHQSFITKRTIVPLYDLTYRYSSDFDWCIRCMKQAKSIYNTRMVLSNFLEGGVSTTQRKASLKERYDVMCKYYGIVSTSLLHVWFAMRFYTAKWFKKKI
ncbi:glycosyltransferase family 2 protein [Parabacteroides gordonii]|jgi:glycosyltransferase involved in cell wall biosynthesis|uniref:glycosyltransferase family 2 protein n=1 Tax=Parabacteroides gordonii TaxID=574930 RepID=UPI00241CA0A3|nr:glycosyltransferase family 2 protein [Parabacteroides gordonii]